jgi:hypothetical protein
MAVSNELEIDPVEAAALVTDKDLSVAFETREVEEIAKEIAGRSK